MSILKKFVKHLNDIDLTSSLEQMKKTDVCPFPK